MIAEFLKSMARRSSDWWWMGGGHFFCHDLVLPLEILGDWVTANQYIVILTDHLYPTMRHLFIFCLDRRALSQDDSASTHRDSGLT